jgi:16S rRNA (cytosine967-C5)-methyltransferase
MRYYSHLNTAIALLQAYRGEKPFSHFIKNYFSDHKKYGSNDRKQISHLCYCYFRLGKTAADLPLQERILLGLWLCTDTSNELLQTLKPGWNNNCSVPSNEKYKNIDPFSFTVPLSLGIDREVFSRSHLQQPDLFLRLRPGREVQVLQQLNDKDISYHRIGAECLVLPNSSKLDGVVQLDTDVVVQDNSSQQIGHFLKMVPLPENASLSVWDCCAASGGKSILAYDILNRIELSVSDIRESILVNLRKRFAAAGIKNYVSFPADLSTGKGRLPEKKYQLIIADLPCSGSGTWGRTPEQLSFFEEAAIEKFNTLQKAILENIIPRLLPGGYLLYSTCSVFRRENEEMVQWIMEKGSFSIVKAEMIIGYTNKADSLFAALLKKDQ